MSRFRYECSVVEGIKLKRIEAHWKQHSPCPMYISYIAMYRKSCPYRYRNSFCTVEPWNNRGTVEPWKKPLSKRQNQSKTTIHKETSI